MHLLNLAAMKNHVHKLRKHFTQQIIYGKGGTVTIELDARILETSL